MNWQLTGNKEDKMALSSHLEELQKKHESLKTEVEDAQRHPGFDQLRLTELKKQKLRIKEEIHRLMEA